MPRSLSTISSGTVGRLPTEILIIIFHLVCSSEEYPITIDDEEDPPIEAPPHTLSHVCRRWRDLVLATHQFWTAIEVRLSISSTSSVKFLELFLRLSGNQPLNLRVWDLEEALKIEGQPGADAWRILNSHFPRCYKLELENDLLGLVDPDSDHPGIQFSFPNLKTFVGFYNINVGMPYFHTAVGQALLAAPNLSEVTTYRPFDALPFSQLTSMTHHFLVASEVASLFCTLPLCTQLQHLSLYSVDLIDIPLSTVHLPTVTTLNLGREPNILPSHVEDQTLGFVLNELSFPSLKELRVGFQTVNDDTRWPEGLLAMLQRSLALTTLSLSVSRYIDRDTWQPPLLSQLLELAPNIQVFELVVDGHEINHRSSNAKILVDFFKNHISQTTWNYAHNLTSMAFSITNLGDFAAFMEAVITAALARHPATYRASGHALPLMKIRILELEYTNGVEDEEFENKFRDLSPSIRGQIGRLKEHGVVIVAGKLLYPADTD